MKQLIKTTVLSALLTIPAISMAQNFSGGGHVGGGDSKSEGRIKEIRNNILDWINAGFAKGLDFKGTGITYETYVNGDAKKKILGMISVLQPVLGNVVVNVIKTSEESASDEEMNTRVDGIPKTCKRFISKKDLKKHILCNYERFWEQSEAEQYKLVHHEYAGLAGVELTDGADSDYVLSNQITMKLKYETVLRLPIKLNSVEGSEISIISNKSNNEEIIYSVSDNTAHFYLRDGDTVVELNKLVSKDFKNELDVKNSLRITNSLISASGTAYNFCWNERLPWAESDSVVTTPASIGMYGLIVGGLASAALCAVLPAVPAAVGIVLAPVDGVFTLSRYLFNTDQIVARKFNKMVTGISSEASSKAFDALKKKITKL
jgi:hypothetical protein